MILRRTSYIVRHIQNWIVVRMDSSAYCHDISHLTQRVNSELAIRIISYRHLQSTIFISHIYIPIEKFSCKRKILLFTLPQLEIEVNLAYNISYLSNGWMSILQTPNSKLGTQCMFSKWNFEWAMMTGSKFICKNDALKSHNKQTRI